MAAINHGSRHVGVPLQVQADAVAVRQAQEPCHFLGIDEVFRLDQGRHQICSIHQ